MRIIWLLALLIASACHAGTSVAFLDVSEGSLAGESLKQWQDWRALVEECLSQNAGVELIERARLDRITEELGLRALGQASGEQAIFQGGWLGAELLIRPVVGGTKESPTLALRLVSVRLGEALAELPVKRPLPAAGIFCQTELIPAVTRARAALQRAAQQKTIAILFFANRTREGRLEYVGEKLRRDLTPALSRTGKFHLLRREEAAAARPETVLAATGWLQPSERWQAQHADILIYGTYTATPDPNVAADELPIHVQYSIYFRARGGSVSNELTLTTATWSNSVQQIAEKISTDAQRVPVGATNALALARVEAARLVEEGNRLLKAKADAFGRRSDIPEEFLEDAPTQAARNFLLATFLAPEREAPLRHLVALQPHWSVDRISLGLEYLSRFGGLTSPEGRHMCCLLFSDITGKLAFLGHGLSETQRAEFCQRHQLLLDIARTAFLQIVSRVGDAVALKGNWGGDYRADLRIEEGMARDIALTIASLSIVPCQMGAWELLTQTAPQWLPAARLMAFRDYGRTATSPAQKTEVRQQLKSWLAQRNKPLTESEFLQLREIYRITFLGDERADQEEIEGLRRGAAGASTALPPASSATVVTTTPATAVVDTPEVAALRQKLNKVPPTEAANVIENEIRKKWHDAAPLTYFPLYARVAERAMVIATVTRWLDEQTQRQHRFSVLEFGLVQQTYETLGAPAWWIKLQRERLRLGKTPWGDWQETTLGPRSIGTQTVIHYPALRLLMPAIQVTPREVAAAEDLPLSPRTESVYGLATKVWSDTASQALFSLEAQLQTRPSETSFGCLLDYNESARRWRNLSDAAGLRHAPITAILTLGQQVFAGTRGSGLCVFDLQAGTGRILTLEAGLPSLFVADLAIVGNQLWISGGEQWPTLARIDLSTWKVFTIPLHDPWGESKALTLWQDRLWFGSLRTLREVDPQSSRLVARQPSNPSIPPGEQQHRWYALDENGLFAVSQNLAVTSFGRPNQDFYRDDQSRFCQVCSIAHAGRPIIGSGFGHDFFRFQSRSDNWRDQVEANIAELQHFRSGQGAVPWKKQRWERKEDRLLPRTRVPSLSTLVPDREWVWALSGKKLFLFRPGTQTWHGCVELPQAANSIAVAGDTIWLSGDKLLTLDRAAILQHAPAHGLPNQLTDADIQEAIARLLLGDQGILYFALGQFERAAVCLEKAVAEDITEPEYFLTLFFIQSPWGLNQPEKWQQTGDRLSELYPNTSWSRTVQDWRAYATQVTGHSKDLP
ncbi:MAG: hypothetical protein PCFJNLEI_00901 [Verrucomicrobiae bacterium]|nr:hypothetical protein [Verrucomicrobiae bacterium]